MYRIRVWRIDDRPAAERNKSGIQKVRKEIVKDTFEEAADALRTVLGLDSAERLGRLELSIESPEESSDDDSLDDLLSGSADDSE